MRLRRIGPHSFRPATITWRQEVGGSAIVARKIRVHREVDMTGQSRSPPGGVDDGHPGTAGAGAAGQEELGELIEINEGERTVVQLREY